MNAGVPGVETVLAAGEGLRAVFQPIVVLATGETVAFEGLVRGAIGSGLEEPERLFALAHDHDMTAWMDWACRRAVFAATLDPGLPGASTLFINVEPEAIDVPCPAPWREPVQRAQAQVPTIFEITERALADKPAQLLRVVEEMRASGAGIALDDVGVDWRSLALMPLIRPDVVKLDRHLVQEPLTARGAIIAEAVRAYAETSGAHILAEGIETETHVQRAIALGATLGQGWRFGGAEPLEGRPPREASTRQQLTLATPVTHGRSPMDVIASRATMAEAPKRDLVAVSRSMERRAMETTEPCVILTVFQDALWFTPTTAALYESLAARAAFVGCFGLGMASEPAPGVRGADLAINQHLLGEWSVILVAPHYVGALIAQDLGDQGPELERRFRFSVLHDRKLVIGAARSLMLTMAAANPAEPLTGSVTLMAADAANAADAADAADAAGEPAVPTPRTPPSGPATLMTTPTPAVPADI